MLQQKCQVANAGTDRDHEATVDAVKTDAGIDWESSGFLDAGTAWSSELDGSNDTCLV